MGLQNLRTNLSQPSKRNLIVIDTFHPCPENLRAIALRARLRCHEASDHNKYSYRSAMTPTIQTLRSVDRILSVIGEEYRARYLGSKFVIEGRQDEVESRKRTWVHFDRWRWVGVLYLNPPEQCQGGTSFFRHKRTGFERWEQVVD